ncbi:unnamed protein product [Linum trigynum]|uniref:Uncharacterized protein n=1 Tax=Linum trigynum TaxID=586398 RepID=A0AAV2FZI0_9ROSI
MSDHLPRPFRFDGLVHTYPGYMFLEPVVINHHRHLQHFENRRLRHFIQLNPYEFNLYKYDIISLIEGLGWDYLLRQPLHLACPGAVKYFYSNLRCQGISTRSFSTIFYGHLLTIPVGALNGILGFLVQGIDIAHPSEFWKQDFILPTEYANFCTEPTGGTDVPIPISWLSPRLRIFHHFITHVFFPRSYNLDVVLPLDLWIIASATAGHKLDYSNLLFANLLPAGDEHYQGLLPFGSIITRLLVNLGIHLSNYRSVSHTMYVGALNVLMILDLPTDIAPSPPPLPSTSILGPRPKPVSTKKGKSAAGESTKNANLVFTVSVGNSPSDDSAASAPEVPSSPVS